MPATVAELSRRCRNLSIGITADWKVDGVTEGQIITGSVRRRLTDVIADRLTDEPVILLEGARAVGKSTLLRMLADSTGARLLDLDDLATRRTVAADPRFAVSGPGPVFVDEYQHVPEVLQAIKAELNVDNRPGRFVLTGSTTRESLPSGTQTLTGRLHVIPVRLLSQAEISGTPGLLPAVLHGHDRRTHNVSTTTRLDYVEHVLAGGFPIALARATRSRERWLDDHITTSLSPDPPMILVGWAWRRCKMPLRGSRIGLAEGPNLRFTKGIS